MLEDEVEGHTDIEGLIHIDDEVEGEIVLDELVGVLELLVEVADEVLNQTPLELELDEYLLLDMLVELSISLDEIVVISATDTVFIALLLTEL